METFLREGVRGRGSEGWRRGKYDAVQFVIHIQCPDVAGSVWERDTDVFAPVVMEEGGWEADVFVFCAEFGG